MLMNRNLWTAWAVAVAACLRASSCWAVAYTDEASWRAAAQGYFLETFDAIPAGTSIPSLPALGIKFDALNDGTYPTVQPYTSTGGQNHTNPHNLLNDADFSLPARGPYVMRPIDPTQTIRALGMWNVGGDDRLRLSFYDANDVLIETASSSPSYGFFGVVTPFGAKRAVVDFLEGNEYSPIDDLQTLIVPEPQAAVSAAILSALAWRRRRTA